VSGSTGAPSEAAPPNLRATFARVLPLAWPVFVGQVAVIAFSTVDTVLVARYGTDDLAALAVGMAAYITIFVTFMGIVMAIGPIAGQAFGAKRHAEAGDAVHQMVWLALALSVIGVALLLVPQPFLALSKATPEVASKVHGYLAGLAVALPGALLFTIYRAFNTAVSRPKAVMALQLAGLAAKVPLSALFVWGAGPIPAMGVTGCGIATAIVMWLQCVAAWWVMRHDAFYAPFALHRPGEFLRRPDLARLRDLLRLGVPMGLGIGLEVMGFSFMAFFIARLGSNAVAGHQIAVNIVSVMFMMALALSNATGTIVAQQVGARSLALARRTGWHGMVIALAASTLLALVVGLLREPITNLYTGNAVVAATALPLLAWAGVFHVFDALQTMAAFVLRSWRIATLPMFVYAASLIGVGLGGGWFLVFSDFASHTPVWASGAKGYWVASVAGLACAALGLTALMVWGLPGRERARAAD
jgi:multidrug resistance protein, MATE family